MKLFMIRDGRRWDHGLNVVEATSEEEAVRLIHPDGVPDHHPIIVEPLEPKGVPGILWFEDESPD